MTSVFHQEEVSEELQSITISERVGGLSLVALNTRTESGGADLGNGVSPLRFLTPFSSRYLRKVS